MRETRHKIVTIWSVHDHCEFEVEPRAFPEPKYWGILLADMARHFANAVAADTGKPYSDLVNDMLEAMVFEMNSTASKLSGEGHLTHEN